MVACTATGRRGVRKKEMWQGRMWRGMARRDMERSDARVVTNEAVVSGDKQQPSGGSGGETSDDK